MCLGFRIISHGHTEKVQQIRKKNATLTSLQKKPFEFPQHEKFPCSGIKRISRFSKTTILNFYVMQLA